MLVVQQHVFPHSYGALLIVYVTGTPPGPAGMGGICNQRLARQWRGGDREAGDAGGATRSGKGRQDPWFPSSPEQRGPSMALLGLVLAGDVVLGDAGVRGVCAPALCFRVKTVNVFGKALLESHGGFWVAHPPWFETHGSSFLL